MCPSDRCTQLRIKKQAGKHKQFCNNREQNSGIQIGMAAFGVPLWVPQVPGAQNFCCDKERFWCYAASQEL
jgi:hypothetical protein